MFDLNPLKQDGRLQRFDCSFQAEGKTARFQFEVNSGEPSGDPPVATGKLTAVAGSDASPFLRKLQKTLEAKTFLEHSKRVAQLPFEAVIPGTHESHSNDGGFFDRPPGNWTVLKILLGKQGHEADVFLNFNPVLRKGEFSIKDPDYGDDVLKELAKVL